MELGIWLKVEYNVHITFFESIKNDKITKSELQKEF